MRLLSLILLLVAGGCLDPGERRPGSEGDTDTDTNTDLDGDGFDGADFGGSDCNDDDAAINPNATEVYYDGIDQNCDGASDYDADEDGFDSEDFGGTDCEDADDSIKPTAEDYCDDIDHNCDGIERPEGAITANATNYSTIQDAVNAAGPGDSINVCSGTYAENVTVANSLSILGFGTAAAPTISASGSGAALTVSSGASLTLSGVTLSNGIGNPHTGGSGEVYQVGGCLDAIDGALLTVTDVNFVNCSADLGGAIAVPATANSTLTRIDISDSDAVYSGGGIYAQGIGSNSVTIVESAFDDASAESGGAVFGYAVDLIVTDSEFTDVNANIGGGIYVYQDDSTAAVLVITDCSFDGATATEYGGALAPINYEIHVQSSTFEQCSAEYGGSIFVQESDMFVFDDVDIAWSNADTGGGLYAVNSTGTITNSVIENSTADFGGGLGLATSSLTATGFNIRNNEATISGGGAYIYFSEVSGVTVSDNDAEYGGGLMLHGPNLLSASSISGNLATKHGGGIYANIDATPGEEFILVQVELNDNRAQERGGGLYVGASSSVTLDDCTVTENTAYTGGSGAYIDRYDSVSSVTSLLSSASEWGTGGTDNAGQDVTNGYYDYSYEGIADFSCSAYTGLCG
jgi:hypothetical protein